MVERHGDTENTEKSATETPSHRGRVFKKKLRVSVPLWLGFSVSLCLSGCGRGEPSEPAPPVATAPIQATAGAAVPGGSMPHGDHNPHHGGVVMMKGDLHFEVVSDAAGRYHVYFTDASRADLPASVAQSVALTIHRTGEPDEPIAMHIDDSGESWEGTGKPVADPAKATVRTAFTMQNEPYWIDLPFKTP